MPIELPAGVITEENWAAFVGVTKSALSHMIAEGEVPAFLGEPMTEEEAVGYLETWLEAHKLTLAEASVDFLASLVKRYAVGDEPDETADEFEASLASLSLEQLTAISEAEAGTVASLKADVIDRRRQLVADGLEVGKTLLRGAVATGLHSLIAAL